MTLEGAQMSDERSFHVVRNDELQYSIWPADREIPAGWTAEGEPAGRERCLARIAEVWTDMRPLSLRQRMEQRVAG